MTREEFESILEEAYMEGYNTAIEDIQEDILDEEAYDLEGEYDYYTEDKMEQDRKEAIKYASDRAKKYGMSDENRRLLVKGLVKGASTNLGKYSNSDKVDNKRKEKMLTAVFRGSKQDHDAMQKTHADFRNKYKEKGWG